MTDDREITKAQRIAEARARLAAAYAADPAAVARFHARKAHLAAAAKRERERFDTLVLGQQPKPASQGPRPKGMGKAEWKIEKERRRVAAVAEQGIAAKWSHKQGTPETLEKFSKRHEGALAQLEQNGTIDAEQREWAAQIDNVWRSIQSDVAVTVASLEARVDQSRSAGHLVGEGIHRVRMHHAYTLWRDQLPLPRSMVLEMIVGEAIGYSVAAERYRVHHRKAKRLLIEALDSWPRCVDAAFRAVTADDVERANAA